MPLLHGPGPKPGWRPTAPLIVAALVSGATIGASETFQVIPIGEDAVVTVFQDEGDFAPPKFTAEEEWVQPTWVIPKAWVTDPSSYQQDDIVPQPSTFKPDEDYWQPVTPTLQPPPTARVWNEGDELPHGAITESDSWKVLPIGDEQLPLALFSDEEIVPQSTAFILEEDHWKQLTLLPVVPIQQPSSHQDEITTVPPPFVPEEDWQTYTPVASLPVVSLFQSIDEIATPPPTFVPEEDYWLQLRADPVELTVIEWPGVGGAVHTVTGTLRVDEEPWRVYTPVPLATRPLYLPEPEELPTLLTPVAQPTESTASGFAARADIQPTFVIWPFEEGLPQPAVPITIDESDWQVWTPGPVAAQPLWLPDASNDPIIPPGTPLTVEEADWQVWTPGLVATQPLYLPDANNDLIVPPPPPLPADEDPWQVYTPPWAVALPLYLPDPEEVPAGSLIRLPNLHRLVMDVETGRIGWMVSGTRTGTPILVVFFD